MSIMLPPGLAKFFSIVTGMKWPEADEDRLRTAGDDYLAIAAEIPELRDWLRRLLTTVHDNDEFAGEAADRFYQRVLPLIGGTGGTDYVTSAGVMAKQLGDFAHKVANQVEYAKWMIIAQLIQLVAQIAWAIAMLPITFGGSVAAIFAAYETAGAIIKQIFIWLFKQLLLHEFLSITTAAVMDGIIQGIQIGKGHKDSWEKESFIQAIEMGAINGLLTGPLELLTFGIGKLFGRILGKGLSKELQADLKALAGSEFKKLSENELKSLSGAELKEVVALLRKNETNLTVREAIAQVRENLAKDLGKTVTKDVGKTVRNNALKELADGVRNNVAKEGAESAFKGAGKEAVENVAQKLSKVEKLTQQMGEAFEQHLVHLGVDKELSNAAGRLVAARLASEGARHAIDLGTFNKLVKTLAESAGGVEIGALKADLKGVLKNIGQMQNELKHLSGDALESGTRDLGFLRAEQQHLSETIRATQDLAERAVGLMDGLHPQTAGQFLYRLGEGVGNYLKGGVQNVLSEGAYNLTFGEDHTFTVSVESFYGGVAMGALGHLGHIAGGPLRLKLADINLPNYARFPLAVVSTLMGHPTSLWVSRPEGAGAGGTVHGAGLPEGTRPEHLKLDSDGSAAPSGDKSAKPSPSTPVKVTGGDEAKAPSASSKSSSDTSTPEPPKRSTTVGGPKEEPGHTPEHTAQQTSESTAATAPAPSHTTPPGTETPVHVPTTGGHPEPSQQQGVHQEQPGGHQRTTHHVEQEAPIQHPLSAEDFGDATTYGRRLTGADDRSGWVVGDPPSAEALKALDLRPLDSSRYALVMHTDAEGLPVHQGEVLSADKLAGAIGALARNGQLDGRTTIDFVACGLAGTSHTDYVAEVMEQVWKDPNLRHLKAVAADGPVWVVPGFDGSTTARTGPGTGHLVVAENVGFDAAGRPVLQGRGNWVEFVHSPSVDGGLIMTVRGSKPPEHYTSGRVAEPIPGTARFGEAEPESDVLRMTRWTEDGGTFVNRPVPYDRITVDGERHGAKAIEDWLKEGGRPLVKGDLATLVQRFLEDAPRTDYRHGQQDEFLADVYRFASYERRREHVEAMEAVERTARRVVEEYPPTEYYYLGLGRSPAGVVAYLHESDHGAMSMPLSSFRPRPQDPMAVAGWGLVSDLGRPNPVPSERQLDHLKMAFDTELGSLTADVLRGRKVLMIDYVQGAQSLVAAQHYVQEYLRSRSDLDSPVVEALAMHQQINTSSVSRIVNAIANPKERTLWRQLVGAPTEMVNRRREWLDKFHLLPLSEDGPVGQSGVKLGELLKNEAFDGFAQFKSLKILEADAQWVEGAVRQVELPDGHFTITDRQLRDILTGTLADHYNRTGDRTVPQALRTELETAFRDALRAEKRGQEGSLTDALVAAYEHRAAAETPEASSQRARTMIDHAMTEQPSYEVLREELRDYLDRREHGEPFGDFGSTVSGRWMGDVKLDASQRWHLAEAFSRFPVRENTFTVAVHGGADGQPTRAGSPITPEEMARTLTELADRGIWNGTDALNFVVCDLAGGVQGHYVTEVMRLLGEKGLGTTAIAANGKVFFVPKVEAGSVVEGPGHLVVASHVGYDPAGRPVLVPGGEFLEFRRPTQEDPRPAPVPLGAHLGPNGHDGAPPEGYGRAATKEELDPNRQLPGALAFADPPAHPTTPTTPHGDGDGTGSAYHYTEAPAHIRAEADGERAERWRQTQRDLQDRYETKLSEAAEELRLDPDGSGHRREEEAERRLSEALDAPDRFPEGAPADLREAVTKRARAMMYTELEARPGDRDRILGDLDGLVRVASVREAAVRVAVQHFERTVGAWSAPRITHGDTGTAHTPERIPEPVVDLVRHDFTVRAEAEAARIYADAESLDAAGNARAGQALQRLTEHVRAELVLHTDRANALAGARELVERAGTDWYDRLSPADRELLAAGGVTDRPDLSPSSLQAIRDRLRERVTADFDRAVGPLDEATGQRRDRDEAVELFTRSLAEREEALPHEFAVQAVREAAIRRAVEEAEKAADSWAGNGARKEFVEKFGGDESDVLRAKATVLRDLAGELDRAAAERVGDPAGLRGALDRLTDPATLTERLTHEAARLAVRRQATTEAQTAAREHGLSGPTADRLTEGHGDRVARAFDESFRSREDTAERHEHWRQSRRELTEELAEHVAFEQEAAPALREAAGGFDGIAARHALNEQLTDHHKGEYGDELFTRYRELWKLAHLDAAGWRSHERAHENAFGRRTEPRPEETADRPAEAGALTVVDRTAAARPVRERGDEVSDLVAGALTPRNAPDRSDLRAPGQERSVVEEPSSEAASPEVASSDVTVQHEAPAAPVAVPVAVPPIALGPEARTGVLARVNELMGGPDGWPGLHMSSGRHVGLNAPGHTTLADVKALADRLTELGALDPAARAAVDALHAEQASAAPAPVKGRPRSADYVPPKLRKQVFDLAKPVVDAAADLLGGPLRPAHADRLGVRIGDEVGPGAANRPDDVQALATSLHRRGRLSEAVRARLTENPADAEARTTLHEETLKLVADHLAGRLDLAAPDSGHRLVAAMDRPDLTMSWKVAGTGSHFQDWATGKREEAPPLAEDTTLNCWESVLLAAHHAGLLSKEWIRDAYADHDVPGWEARLRGKLLPHGPTSYDSGNPESPLPRAGDIVITSKDLSHVALATGRTNADGVPLVLSFGVESESGNFSADKVSVAPLDDVLIMQADFGPGPWFRQGTDSEAPVPPPRPSRLEVPAQLPLPAPVRTVSHGTPDPQPLVPLVPRPGTDRTPRFVVRSSFDARRFDHGGPVTDLTVRIAFRDGGGHDTGAVWDKVVQGVEEYLNKPGYRLTNGDRMHVTVLPVEPGQKPHLTVDLVGHDRPMDQQSWRPDADPIDYAHEVGHQIGLRDEYRTQDLTHRPDVKGSLLGDHRALAPSGLRQGGLRERHLSLISRVVGDLERPPTSGPRDLTWQQARDAAASYERNHVWVDPVSKPGTVGHDGGPQEVAPLMADGGWIDPPAEGEWIVMHPPYASGDQWGIAAAMLINSRLHVLIARGPGPGEAGHDPVLDKSAQIEAFYRSAGIPDADLRIHVVTASSMEKSALWRTLRTEATSIAENQWGETWEQRPWGQVVRGITDGTYYLGGAFREAEHRDAIRAAWGMNDRFDPEIGVWLTNRGIQPPPVDAKVLVLWSRFSGKAAQWSDVSGRMEHDTSFEGMRQLLREFAGDYHTVIITGDPHPTRSGKWNELVARMRHELGKEQIHHVTGFWRGRDESVSAWTQDTRVGQLRLYDYFHRRNQLDHLGFRSGNLESVALIGHNVSYLEEFDATGANRMTRWHVDTMTGKTSLGGDPVGYERVQVSAPPTASGQHATPYDAKRDGHLTFTPEESALWRKPAGVYTHQRGFDYQALVDVREGLSHSAPGMRVDQDTFWADRVRYLQRRYEKLRADFVTHADGADVESSLTHYDGQFRGEIEPGTGLAWYQQMTLLLETPGYMPDLLQGSRAYREPYLTMMGHLGEYRVLLEVPRNGDDFYHAVSAWFGTAGEPRTLRDWAVNWMDANRQLVEEYAGRFGTTYEYLRTTVGTDGRWAGNAGVMVPHLVASALGVKIDLHDGNTWKLLSPLDGTWNGGRIQLGLADGHFRPLVRDVAPGGTGGPGGPGGPGGSESLGKRSQPDDDDGGQGEDQTSKKPKSTLPPPASTGQDGQVVAAHTPIGLGGGGMPVPGPLHERVQALEHLSSEERRLLVEDGAFQESLRQLEPEDYAQAAAKLLIDVDPRTHQPVAARRTAENLVARMLANKAVAERVVASGVRIGVVPRDVPMTEVSGFVASEHGTGDGRDWSVVRGSSGPTTVLITEENLLGARTRIGRIPTYAEGYSSSAHELAHTIHEFGLTQAEKELIGQAYRERSVADALAELFGEEPLTDWPDGGLNDGEGNRVGNYSARNEHEFFAQLVTAYLGHNHGNDPSTGLPRNNGAEWVRENAPELVELLGDLFGHGPQPERTEPANKVGRTDAEEQLFEGFREFMETATTKTEEQPLHVEVQEQPAHIEVQEESAQHTEDESDHLSLDQQIELALNPGATENTVTENTVTENPVTENTVTENTVVEDTVVEPPLVVAAPIVVPPPEQPLVPTPPTRLRERGLSAYDVLVHLENLPAQHFESLVGRFTAALHGDGKAARTLAESLFGSETLRPTVSALSRGDVREVPFQAGRWSGQIRISAALGEARHLKTLRNFEFEYGSEQQSTVGVSKDRLTQVNAGAQLRAKLGSARDLTETLGYQHGWMNGSTSAEASRTSARGKTVELADLFEAPFTLTVEFLDAKFHGAPGPWHTPQPIDLPVTGHVAVPKRETANLPPVAEAHYAVPLEVSEHRRLAGSHIVTDVWPLEPPRRRQGENDANEVEMTDLNQRQPAVPPIGKFVAGFEEAAERYFGSRWPELRRRLLTELDLGTLQQELKGTMAGQKLTIVDDSLVGAAAMITIGSGSVARMRQVHTLPTTEINISTATTRAHVEQTTTSKEWHMLPSSVTNKTDGNFVGGGGLGARAGRDGVGLHGSGSDLGNGTKIKRPAVLFEGAADLTVTFGWSGGLLPHPAEATTRVELGFRTVIDQDEAVLVTGADHVVEGTNPPEFVAQRPAPPLTPANETGALVRAPLDAVWTGLPDTTVVRDLRDITPLHTELDRVGALLLGEKAWKEVREDVLQAYSHSAVSAHLVGMSRGSALRGPEVTMGPLKDLHLATTVRLHRMTHLRGQATAELNPVRETSTFDSARHLRSDTVNGQFQLAGKGTVFTHENVLKASGKPFEDVLQGTVVPSLESRIRDGWRSGESDKGYANGKYLSPQELYRAEFEVLLKVNGRDFGPVLLTTELSLEQVHTAPHTIAPNERHGFVVPPGLHEQALTPPPHVPQRADEQAAPPLRLGQSDVVLSLGRGDTAVLRTVLDALQAHTGRPVPANVEALLARSIDAYGLKSALSRLSRGGRIRVPLEFDGWKGTVVVGGDLLRPQPREELLASFEFESGSQQRTTTGTTADLRTRLRIRARAGITLPYVNLTGEYTHTRDFVKGISIDRVGGTNSRGKSVEPARLTDVDAVFTVTFETSKRSHAIAPPAPVTASAVVAAPQRVREAVPRMLPTHRLGSSDVITAVHLNQDRSGTVHDLVLGLGATLFGNGGHTVADFLGKDWTGMARKLSARLDFDRLQIQLKSVMAGHPLVVEHGRSTAVITAEVVQLTPTGRPPQVEFNIGNSHQTSLTSSDGGTNTGGGSGHAFTGGLYVTGDPAGTGVGPVGGPTFTYAKGVDRLEHGNDSSSSGTAIKSKVAAVAHQAAVVLKIRFEHEPVVLLHPADAIRPDRVPRPSDDDRSVLGKVNRSLTRIGDQLTGLGRYRRTLVEATIHADVLMETGRDEAVVPSRYGAPKTGFPSLRPPEEVGTRVLRRPPESLFREGVRDVGILRWIDDTSGVRDLLTVFGPRFFKKGTWSWLESVARNTHSHAQLSALFGSVSRGRDVQHFEDGPDRDVLAPGGRSITTPSVGKRFLVDDADVTATVSIVQLEYQRDNTAAAISPANDSGGGGRHTRLDWGQWNLQVQGGAKAGLDGGVDLTGLLTVGGGKRWREGPSTGASGKIVAGAKFPEPTARYTGYAEVEVTFRDGDRTLTEKGLVPIEMEVPIGETTELTSAGHQRVLFTALHPEGETTHRNSVSDAVADLLATPLAGAGDRVHLLADPNERDTPAYHDLVEALRVLPHDDPYFTMVFHGRPEDGAPLLHGEEVTPEQFAGALLRLAEGGQWQGEPLRFLSCNSAVGGAGSFAGRTVQALHEQLAARRAEAALGGQPLSENLARLTDLVAFAGNGSVYLTVGNDPRAVVARTVGFTADGRPLVDGPGDWLRLHVEEDQVRTTALGQELLHEGQERVPLATEDDPIDPNQPAPVRLLDEEDVAPVVEEQADHDAEPVVEDPAPVVVPVAGHGAAPVVEQDVAPAAPPVGPPTWQVQRRRAWALLQPEPEPQTMPGPKTEQETAAENAVRAANLRRLAYDYGTGADALTALTARLRERPAGTDATVAVTRPDGHDALLTLRLHEDGSLRLVRPDGGERPVTIRTDEAEPTTRILEVPAEADGAEAPLLQEAGRVTSETHLWVTMSNDHVSGEALTRLGANTYTIRAENSGDMYHMRAALIAHPDRALLVWNVSESTRRQVEGIINLHDDLFTQGRRIHYTTETRLPTGQSWRNETAASEDIATRLTRSVVGDHMRLTDRILPRQRRFPSTNDQLALMVRKLTEIQADVSRYRGRGEEGGELSLRAARIAELGDAYGHYTEEEAEAFQQDLENPALGRFEPGQNYVIVTYRDSGHSNRAGANAPALDTGLEGVRQIIEQVQEAANGRFRVVVMGEEPAEWSGPALQNYWNWPSVGNRRKELALLRYLADEYNIVGAVGMRSGVMDELAFAGIKVISIDISPHRNEGDGIPNLKQSKGWTRGLRFEEAYERNYGRAFVTDPRPEDTTYAAPGATTPVPFPGRFSADDVLTIRSAVEFYLVDDPDSAGFRHDSHPHERLRVEAALDRLGPVATMTGLQLAQRTLPYLREFREFKARIPEVWDLVEPRLMEAEDAAADYQNRAAEACRQAVADFPEGLTALGVTAASDLLAKVGPGPLSAQHPIEEVGAMFIEEIRTALRKALPKGATPAVREWITNASPEQLRTVLRRCLEVYGGLP
ncbi:hypothetical protein ACFU7Y_17360 [Kitasatospora sp. NPDC057542]|uniref:WXG100-like domain-containing protein n=1 Tax=Kitasatospora sp. NPDC057542 TaxID=3346162 RepID=UPI0036A8FEFE